MTRWCDSDGFWEAHRAAMFHDRRLDAAPGQVDAMLRITGLGPGARVLDLPCGVGRHSLAFARRGCRVTGVDRTPAYLERCREGAALLRGCEEAFCEPEFVQADMREFRRASAFDLIVNYYTSFGYFETEAENRRVLEHWRVSLAPGGRLIMETLGKEILARTFQPRQWQHVGTAIHLQETRILRDWTWVESHWTVIEGAERREDVVSHRIYSARELADEMRAAGFGTVACYGSIEGAPYDDKAERLIVIASA